MGRTNNTNASLAVYPIHSRCGSTINSTSADTSTARLDVLLRIDALERALQSGDWALGVLGVIAGHIAAYATTSSRSSDRVRGDG